MFIFSLVRFFSRQSFFRVSYTCSSNYSVYDGRCTHTLTCRTHIFLLHSASHCVLPHIFMHVHIHAWLKSQVSEKKVFACVSLISPSRFLLSHDSPVFLAVPDTVTSRPNPTTTSLLTPTSTMILPYFPVLKAQDTRNSAPASRSLATWPNQMQTQVTSPRSSTRSLPWTMTRCSPTIRTTISPTSRKPRTRTLNNLVFSQCFESSVSQRFSWWFCSSGGKQRKHAVGKPLLDREK